MGIPVMLWLLAACGPAGDTATVPAIRGISGRVISEQGEAVPGATVRVQATETSTTTNLAGEFRLENVEPGTMVTISAWKDGYYCAKVEEVVPPTMDVSLTLIRYQTNDNPNYEWVPPTGEDSCFSCKSGVTEIWMENAHAGAATNERFLSMYSGQDLSGNQSPLTRLGFHRDYGSFPLRPDPGLPYYGPGYKLDFPDTAGSCAACHTPGAAVDAPYGTNPIEVTGVNQFGVHCDFCHKVADVSLDEATGRPYPNMPGVLSMDIRRPFPEDPLRYQLFFGTFDDDNVPEEDTMLPLIMESQFCAPCHFGVFWDTLIYNSFGEWLDSPYADPDTGRTCQQCHMPAPAVLDGEVLTNVAPESIGVERDPMTIHAHIQPGASSEEFLQDAVEMEVSAARQGTEVSVQVSITNHNTGHHVPTDSPLRQMILLVVAMDTNGETLEQLEGPRVPEWGGFGDPSQGYYAGLPGMGFAKILMELWTEVTPTGAYWNPTVLVSDNRLAAFATDTSAYVFTAPPGGTVTIEVKLLFRRAFIELMDQKGWDVPDILMEHAVLTLEE
jgi:hypothetical protein